MAMIYTIVNVWHDFTKSSHVDINTNLKNIIILGVELVGAKLFIVKDTYL